MNYYTSDLHFCHENVLRYDGRPWDDINSMEYDMIDWWNKKITSDDDVYILGDLCFGNAGNWRRIVPQLNGRKHLIIGNHDLRGQFPEDIVAMFAEPPVPYKVVKDGDYYVLMSHYPMISYHHDSNPNTLMFYGHVHNTPEFDAVMESVNTMKECCQAVGFDYRGRLYNCWCGFYGWVPASLMEVLTNKYSHCRIKQGNNIKTIETRNMNNTEYSKAKRNPLKPNERQKKYQHINDQFGPALNKLAGNEASDKSSEEKHITQK